MKKIIICDIPLREDLDKALYPEDKTLGVEKAQEVVFPINACLPSILDDDKEVKVILIAKDTENQWVKKNLEIFKNEFSAFSKGKQVEYKTIILPFEETKDINDLLLKGIISEIEDGSEIYCDITFGPRTLPIVLFVALNFAEKFCKCDIRNIIYGKVEFVKGQIKNGKIYDLLSLYYLNSINEKMSFSSSNEAKEALDLLLGM